MIPIAEFRVPYTRFTGAHGYLPHPRPISSRRTCCRARAMALTRAFDAKAVALQRTGQLRTYPSSLGQEAVTVGLASVMRAEDVLLHLPAKPGPCSGAACACKSCAVWSGDERGQRLAGPREETPDCRADCQPVRPRRGRGLCLSVSPPAACGGGDAGRWRHLQGRFLEP